MKKRAHARWSGWKSMSGVICEQMEAVKVKEKGLKDDSETSPSLCLTVYSHISVGAAQGGEGI